MLAIIKMHFGKLFKVDKQEQVFAMPISQDLQQELAFKMVQILLVIGLQLFLVLVQV